MPSTPISTKDIVSVEGNYLVKGDGTRFLMKGIGFPISYLEGYNETAWIGILHQLESLKLEYNTVRIYEMDPAIDYSNFMNEAAELGVYVIVPLTAKDGHGVLSRDKAAPKCYPRKLFRYGVSCLHNYMQYPNVVAGLLGNEVINTLESWPAAPCVKAYGRDLKLYMKNTMELEGQRPLPLIYAAQHSGIGAAYSADDVMKITMDYLTCGEAAIDVFGVNIETWCSSQATFELDEDGEVGSYYSLYQSMNHSKIPLIFTEMGCSHDYFDKDNGLHDNYGSRDWKQVPIVLNEMVDTWSGFCAYAYSGNPMFDMFKGGPWRDAPLEPTQDFHNFRHELHKLSHVTNVATTNVTTTKEDSVQQTTTQSSLLTTSLKEYPLSTSSKCADVEKALASCDIHLKSFSKIVPYHYVSNAQAIEGHIHVISLVIVGVVGFFLIKRFRARKKVEYVELQC